MATITFLINLFTFSIFYISSSLCLSATSWNYSNYDASDELANQVCKNTSNYNFCREAIYADPRAPDADRYVLSDIAFGRAYLNATSSSNAIVSLLKNMTNSMQHDKMMLENLKKCKGHYKEAVRVLAEAFSDLDSETFNELDAIAVYAGKNARKCEVILKGDRILSKKNQDLIRLSEVCVVVSNLYDVR